MAGIEVDTCIKQTECYQYYFITELPLSWLVWKSSQAYSWIHFGQLRNKSSICPEVDERVVFDLLLLLCIIWLTSLPNFACVAFLQMKKTYCPYSSKPDWWWYYLPKSYWISYSICELYHLSYMWAISSVGMDGWVDGWMWENTCYSDRVDLYPVSLVLSVVWFSLVYCIFSYPLEAIS